MHIRNLILLLSVVLVAFGASVSATTVSISPHQVDPGDTITVTVQGLPDESQVKMDWEVYIDEPGPNFLWTVDGLAFPINLQNASFRVTNQNTETNRVTLKNDVPYYGSRELTLSGDSVNGVWTAFHGNDFINGTWPVIRNEGTTQAGKTSVLSLVEWYGIKRANPAIPEQQNGGPQNFAIQLSFSGFESGRVKFTIQVNGTNVLTDTVTIGTPVSRYGTLYIRSNPSAADVYVDGVSYGITPRKVTGVPPGLRTVKLTKEGYADYVTQVQVSTTGMTVVVATLSPASASIKVSSVPQRAAVYLDDQLVGTTPMTITDVPPGTHHLKLTKAGYQDYHLTVVTTDGETVRLPYLILKKSSTSVGVVLSAEDQPKTGAVSRFDTDAYMEKVMARFKSVG